MKQAPKEFNQESYDRSDFEAKEILTQYLESKGYKILNIEEDFNHDVVAEYNKKPALFEVEFKTGYPFTSRQTFPFSTVSFLGRKKRLHDIQPFTYVIICKETNWAVAARSGTIFNDHYIETLEVDSIDRKGEDLFFRVPKESCNFIDLGDLSQLATA